MATDIAFALGVIALLGARVPSALKVFVVAFAVIDDLGAIVLIATVYTAEISFTWLALALGDLGAAHRCSTGRCASCRSWPYLLGGAFLWFCVLNAGIHASIAGVMLAFAIPFSPRTTGSRIALAPAGALAAQAGRVSDPAAVCAGEYRSACRPGGALHSSATTTASASRSGLILGKPLGVIAMCFAGGGLRRELAAGWFAVAAHHGRGFARRHRLHHVDLHHQPRVHADHAEFINSSKLAVLIASLVAGVLGMLWLRLTAKNHT